MTSINDKNEENMMETVVERSNFTNFKTEFNKNRKSVNQQKEKRIKIRSEINSFILQRIF